MSLSQRPCLKKDNRYSANTPEKKKITCSEVIKEGQADSVLGHEEIYHY